ncbi:hypothetical protein HRbin10_01216 [bacterium HR10]|nr:hypothetical protein HRbin10_01216 [bacterium HR10]
MPADVSLARFFEADAPVLFCGQLETVSRAG